MPRVTVQVRDVAGHTATATADYELRQSVLGGYYLSGGADPSADMAGGNFRSLTQYRSFADGYIFPGYNRPWLINLGKAGVQMNMVLELKHYGAPSGPQTFTVDGTSYTVPAPSMTIQQRPGTTWPKAYGYNQVVDGQCDGLFARALSQYRTLGFGVNIQIASELDTDHEFGTTEAGKAYTWEGSDWRAVQAINYILTWFKARTLPAGTTFSVGVGGFDRACFQRTHPESLMSRLDFLQWNVYATDASHTALGRFRRTKDWAVADLGPVALSRRVIIAEWGVRSAEIPNQSGWIATVPAAIAQLNAERGPRITQTNYFNSGWGTLSPKEAGLAALHSAYGTRPFI
ncbi:hypothetical protein F8271_04355 [Micromonospora sp. ALFpr18c]|uniref:hypothetical protein n=1 Tax=unclassified Micromonospora TaxID=2617518 RepID=UPI00124BAAD8|nr:MULTISPECIES: hypothetical protein [unclassified Micromonospora]KAB1947560.1 hypothetical protein F8271_04355 [Micromonospora sp. ALFpr18c]MDG4756664.1 hypothetical protein [Micromonospora sp. WMMD710]